MAKKVLLRRAIQGCGLLVIVLETHARPYTAQPWGKLWRGCTTYPEVLETARDASKATAEVACGCELRFDRLPRAVGSG
jgi:hypothetical protein